MHILLLTNRVPYPLKDGGSLAMHYFIEGYMEAGVKVSLLAMNTSKHFIETDKLPAIYKKLEHFQTINVNNDIKIWNAFVNLFQPNKSYNIERFDNKDFHNALTKLLNE